MKTVTDKGKEYQIGAVYEFTSNGSFCVDVLLGVHVEGANKGMFTCVNADYTEIREVLRPLGTIKEAPIELKDGAAYQFDYSADGDKSAIGVNGVYQFIHNFFVLKDKKIHRNHCTNIVKLVPEVK